METQHWFGGDRTDPQMPSRSMRPQPLGISVPENFGAEIEPEKSRVYGQQTQTVQGPQTNIAGDPRSPVLSGSFHAPVLIGGTVTFDAGPIHWDSVDYTPHLKRTRALFFEYMRRFAGAESEEDAEQRYFHLRLQETLFPHNDRRSEKRVDIWANLVHYPQTMLVTGAPGSGKTTLLLYIGRQLAEDALSDPDAPLPFYLPLRTFTGGHADTLLDMAAYASGVEPRLLQALWRERHRPLCLLLDGADEISPVLKTALISAIEGLYRASPVNYHTFIVTSRLGQVQEALERSDMELYGFIMASLNDADINHFLANYGVPELSSLLAARLREVVQSPDLLSALAQSTKGTSLTEVPRNAGQIYQLLIDYHLFSGSDGQYDYWRVKRPILASLAYIMLAQERNYVLRNDALDDQIAQQLESLHLHYNRRRKVMPDDWSAQGFLDELLASPMVEQLPGHDTALIFSKLGYCEYFAAVHLATLGVGSAEVQQILPTLNRERWVQPLIILLGILPEAVTLFDSLYHPDPQLASELWFEDTPQGVEAPTVIRTAHAHQIEALETSPFVHFDEPITFNLLTRMLNDSDPRQRIRAARALSQWGFTALDAMLDAAEDDHPLVQAVAWHALIHLGESLAIGGRPIPPLLDLEDGQLHFSSAGGCNVRIGPLHLLQVPESVAAELVLNIESLDFDPFTERAAFLLWHTAPAWLAATWFDCRRLVDWIGLTARCQWIAKYAEAVALRAETRPVLNDLTAELRQCAVRYNCLGYRLAKDLGIPWQRGELLRQFDWAEADAEMTYQQLRFLFNRTNRSRFLGLVIPEESRSITKDDVSIQVTQRLERLTDTLRAIEVEKVQAFDVDSKSSDTGEQAEVSKFLQLQFVQNVQQLEGGHLGGVKIAWLHATKQHLPPFLIIEGVLNVDRAFSGTITGLEVGKLTGGSGGVRIPLVINIKHFEASRLNGIRFSDVAPIHRRGVRTSAGLKLPKEGSTSLEEIHRDDLVAEVTPLQEQSSSPEGSRRRGVADSPDTPG